MKKIPLDSVPELVKVNHLYHVPHNLLSSLYCINYIKEGILANIQKLAILQHRISGRPKVLLSLTRNAYSLFLKIMKYGGKNILIILFNVLNIFIFNISKS